MVSNGILVALTIELPKFEQQVSMCIYAGPLMFDKYMSDQMSVVAIQLLSHVQFFVTP